MKLNKFFVIGALSILPILGIAQPTIGYLPDSQTLKIQLHVGPIAPLEGEIIQNRDYSFWGKPLPYQKISGFRPQGYDNFYWIDDEYALRLAVLAFIVDGKQEADHGRGWTAIQTAAVNPGNTGWPFFDINGRVIGAEIGSSIVEPAIPAFYTYPANTRSHYERRYIAIGLSDSIKPIDNETASLILPLDRAARELIRQRFLDRIEILKDMGTMAQWQGRKGSLDELLADPLWGSAGIPTTITFSWPEPKVAV